MFEALTAEERTRAARKSKAACSPFIAGTGIMGATESGQRVTRENVHHLPPGSVVRLDSGGRLIHLHDGLWLYCTDCSWCYDNIDRHRTRLPGTLCHIPANAKLSGGEAVRADVLFGASVVRADGFRSVPRVNVDDDMVRVTLDMPKHTWRELHKRIPSNAGGHLRTTAGRT